MKCNIANLTIDFINFKSLLFINSLKKYEVSKEKRNNYSVESKKVLRYYYDINDRIYISKFYDLFFDGDYYYQMQKDYTDNKYCGKIIYLDSMAIILYKSQIKQTDIEYLLTQYVINYFISKEQNGIIIHGSAIYYKKSAILFCAPSGTGKSTHTRMWKKYSNISYINDDKNIVKHEETLYLYGNPWSGKHHLDNNIKAPLKAIIFLEQAPENSITKLQKFDFFKRLLKQINIPSHLVDKNNWTTITDELLNIPSYLLKCNMDKEAFLTAKNEIDKLI